MICILRDENFLMMKKERMAKSCSSIYQMRSELEPELSVSEQVTGGTQSPAGLEKVEKKKTQTKITIIWTILVSMKNLWTDLLSITVQ